MQDGGWFELIKKCRNKDKENKFWSCGSEIQPLLSVGKTKRISIVNAIGL